MIASRQRARRPQLAGSSGAPAWTVPKAPLMSPRCAVSGAAGLLAATGAGAGGAARRSRGAEGSRKRDMTVSRSAPEGFGHRPGTADRRQVTTEAAHGGGARPGNPDAERYFAGVSYRRCVTAGSSQPAIPYSG